MLKIFKKTKKITINDIRSNKNKDELQIVDIRSDAKMSKGMIENSVKYEKSKLDKNKKVVIVCNQGIGAKILSKKLNKEGYDTYVLEGGYNATKTSK